MIADCGAVQRIFFAGRGRRGKYLPVILPGSPPVPAPAGKFRFYTKKYYGELIFLCTFTDCTSNEQWL
jgi:hypothetical protein